MGYIKLIVRMDGERPRMVQEMERSGACARLIKGATLIEPHSHHDGGEKIYEIPQIISEGTFLIELTEHGGGSTNTGEGVIVCGLSGKALRPYYKPSRGQSNAEHAFFSVPNKVITITGFGKDGRIKIEEHAIVKAGGNNQCRITSSTLWTGLIDELPNTFSRYTDAAQAAYSKGCCYHCRDCHYITE